MMGMTLKTVVSGTELAMEGWLDLQIEVLSGDEIETLPFTYNPDDPYGLAPTVRDWLGTHPEFTSAPAPTPTLEEMKAAKAAAIETEGTSRLSVGFSHDFGAPYGVKVLQLRPGTEDRQNWTNALLGYQLQIMAGNGAVEGARIRPEDNETVTTSFAAGAAALGAMLAWGQAHYETVWTKKDAIAAATTEAELDAVTVDTGWPA
jgi:hypothetical protein